MLLKDVDGTGVPALGLGTWQITGDACTKAVKTALNAGYRHIDTAEAYDNQAKVGDGIEQADVDRDEFFLTTKVWRTNLGYEEVLQSAEESLAKLGTEYIDLLLVHWPNESYDFEETMRAFSELKEAGKIRNIGVSNFEPDQLDDALSVEPSIITDQVEMHPFLRQEALQTACREHDILLTAYSPLARGRVMEDEVLQAIAAEYDRSPAQVALRWLLQKENVIAIPKSSTPAHIRENLEALEFELDDAAMERIDGIDRRVRCVDPGFAPW